MGSIRTIVGGALALVACALPAAAADTKAGALVIRQPWSRATPAGATTAAGYVTILNTGDQPDRLVRATAEAAGKISIHSMRMTDGVMEMRELPNGVVIPPHGSVELKPGGLHLMIEGLGHPLKRGDHLAGTLAFDKAGAVPVTFEVQGIGATKPPAVMPGMTMD